MLRAKSRVRKIEVCEIVELNAVALYPIFF